MVKNITERRLERSLNINFDLVTASQKKHKFCVCNLLSCSLTDMLLILADGTNVV